ncbi:MAG: hypothetical protein JWM47_3603 [Acidimicrobiales bacterium]|nr:hypothetical protein [Acidimicrobiales bacterium]
MRVAARLAVLLWQRGGARQRASSALTAAGVAFSVALALVALSAGPALAARGDRVAWHGARAVDASRATALQRTVSDVYRDRYVTRVDLAPTGHGRPPTPPGLPAFPRPGELWLSPALADAMASQPRGVLADRYPGTVAGEIGPSGLGHVDELVVVVGRAPGALSPTPGVDRIQGPPFEGAAVVPVDTFARHGLDHSLALYRTLALVGTVMLVVPTALLVGAAARLTAAQREQRLAVLRLAGATPGTVVALTALEVLGAALVGMVIGTVGYLGLLPLAAHIPLAGGPFSPVELRLGSPWIVAAVVGVPLLAAASAVAALRRVAIGPLGVSRQLGRRRPRLARLVVVPLSWVGLALGAGQMEDGGSAVGAILGIGAVIGALAVVGPVVTRVIGSVLTALARRPATLLAGRRITADTKGAYRTVSGMVLASLLAGFLFGVVPSVQGLEPGEGGARDVRVEVAQARAPAMRAAVRVADPGAQIDVGPGDSRPHTMTEPSEHGVVIASSVEGVERVRTAVLAADPDGVLALTDDRPSTLELLGDLRRASAVMALATLAMAVVSITISGSAAILDQRLTLARLRLVGTPISVLQRARRWQTLLPLVSASTGAMAVGAVAGLTMLRAFGARPDQIAAPAFVEMGVLGVAAAAAGALVVAATRPLLEAASRSTPRE